MAVLASVNVPDDLVERLCGKTVQRLHALAANADENGCEALAAEIDAVAAQMEALGIDRLPRPQRRQIPSSEFELE